MMRLVPLKGKEDSPLSTRACTKKDCVCKMRWQPSANQEESSRQEPNLPAP